MSEALPVVDHDFVVQCQADYDAAFAAGKAEDIHSARLRWGAMHVHAWAWEWLGCPCTAWLVAAWRMRNWCMEGSMRSAHCMGELHGRGCA